MTISIELLETKTGHPLSAAGTYLTAPWDKSASRPLAAEQADPIAVSRTGASRVNLVWSPDSGLTARADLVIRATVSEPEPVDNYLVIWGDAELTTYPGYNLSDFHLTARHTFLADSVLITVVARRIDNSVIESDTLVPTYTRDSYWRIHQYRIEKFKGREEYNAYGDRWIADWAAFTGDSMEMDLDDYEAASGWNWGYRLWLREIDDQDRPGLTTVPSGWTQTGTGEGYA